MPGAVRVPLRVCHRRRARKTWLRQKTCGKVTHSHEQCDTNRVSQSLTDLLLSRLILQSSARRSNSGKINLRQDSQPHTEPKKTVELSSCTYETSALQPSLPGQAPRAQVCLSTGELPVLGPVWDQVSGGRRHRACLSGLDGRAHGRCDDGKPGVAFSSCSSSRRACSTSRVAAKLSLSFSSDHWPGHAVSC